MKEQCLKIAESFEKIAECYRKIANDSDEEANISIPKKDTKSVTIDIAEVRKVLAEKKQAGKGDEIKALLKKYGAEKLSGIAQESYAALLSEAEGL